MPVIIERKYGDGSIVLAADSYFREQRSAAQERHPRLLARLFSGPPQIIFDEEHHGVRDNPGIASLARKYRLHGVVAGLAARSRCFFVWKNSVRFHPAPTNRSPRTATSSSARNPREGFINLLRRSIRPPRSSPRASRNGARPPRTIRATSRRSRKSGAQEQARPPRERDPVAAYRAISRALVRKT